MIPHIGMTMAGPSGPDSVRLDNLTGAGAFGSVFAATDLRANCRLAVKFPQTLGLGSADRAEIQAFTNEVAAAATLQHPNIVRVLYAQADLEAGVPYLVMEYVEGGTLAQLLRKAGESKEPLAIPSLVDWMGQLVDGIEAINEKMLHRDLRPENILMSGDRLKVGDFGLSKLVGAATRTRTFKGSQHVLYMAPEGWRSETNDIQIDMYSMGITFFEMATLEYPYDVPPGTGSFEALERMHLFEVPKDVRALREDLPVGIV